MKLHCRFVCTLLLIVLIFAALAVLRANAQAVPAQATFEVASVKANKSGTTQTSINVQGGTATLVNLPLRPIQLGLKLDPQRENVEVLVIERLERPAEN